MTVPGSIAYDVSGRGPRVLFIQGVGVPGHGWEPQLDGLANEFTCLTFDNRGVGRSAGVDGALSVAQMVADTQRVMDQAGWDDAHVVGHSLGGLVAQQLALTARQRVKSLALLCTFADGKAVAPLTLRMMMLGLGSQLGTKAMRRRGFLRLVLSPGATIDDATVARMSDLFGRDLSKQPPIVDVQLKAMRACSVVPRLGELAGLPTLVVSAPHDPLAPPTLGHAIAAGIPGARYAEVAGASHAMPITHAADVNALLRAHIAAVPELQSERIAIR